MRTDKISPQLRDAGKETDEESKSTSKRMCEQQKSVKKRMCEGETRN